MTIALQIVNLMRNRLTGLYYEYNLGDLVQLYYDTAEMDIPHNVLDHVIIL